MVWGRIRVASNITVTFGKRGTNSEIPPELRDQASRFAAKSDSFSKLTSDEKRELDAFVKFLKTESHQL
jgi:hypothetical protein